jgi:2,3-bisphosphoglycerate-independent phosphoglycerate mutase
VQRSYDDGVTDEFIKPICVEGAPGVEPGDSVIFFNFRPDRARQLTRLLLDNGFPVTSMTRYASDLDTSVVFAEQHVENTLAQVLSAHGLKQLHAAETEKYAHVTYFFNGGREEPWPGEERILAPSPRDVPSYDQKPEMSADAVADQVCATLDKTFSFLVVNFANPDMVGHTGVIPAVVKACETADRCLGQVAARVQELGGVCLVTADHGNAEQMLEDDGVSPHTAHTTNPVPLVLTARDFALRQRGEIADLAPTVLELLGIERPAEMTGTPLASP